jgi:predicted metal-dependent hydrolase
MDQKIIPFSGKKLAVDIRTDRRAKGYRLSIQGGGRFKLTLPRPLPDKDIQTLMARHRRWIHNRLREQAMQSQVGNPFSLTDGASLPVLNGKVRLSLKVNGKLGPHWRFRDEVLQATVTHATELRIYTVVQHWYRCIARAFLEDRIPFWADRIHAEYCRISVKDQRSLWASCSKNKNLNFNWRTLLLPFSTAEYLIIHELCHLHELNHSKKFWAMVEKHCPNHRKENDYLKKVNHWLKFPSF